ncbi:hypothetical protein FJT64_006692 [Amphibalanus amphitrite]|uniref:Uncharacterized protein n=1 Tax=Amphibalanus amphitrite TaxID=1232801 RepID=A0A6A4VY79_AMPAM|nr:hypothetical protein FJT64_006692 [Amphibalanus amphitrite]
MCAKLCAAGEGGSFCNCLRPPTSWAGRRRKAAALRRRCAALCALNPTTSLCDCSAPAARPRPAAVAVAAAVPDRTQAATAPGDGDGDGGAQGTTSAPGEDPDWDIICYDLCLLGDGGLLCHCDLLPFRPSGR